MSKDSLKWSPPKRASKPAPTSDGDGPKPADAKVPAAGLWMRRQPERVGAVAPHSAGIRPAGSRRCSYNSAYDDAPVPGGRDTLDCEYARPPWGAPGPQTASPCDDGTTQLDKAAIVYGMGAVKGAVLACFDEYRVPGMATATLTIERSGHVSRVGITGQFAGTPTGECVERAVHAASFPPFTGEPQTINYPYILR
jgi:hypothetical protein